MARDLRMRRFEQRSSGGNFLLQSNANVGGLSAGGIGVRARRICMRTRRIGVCTDRIGVCTCRIGIQACSVGICARRSGFCTCRRGFCTCRVELYLAVLEISGQGLRPNLTLRVALCQCGKSFLEVGEPLQVRRLLLIDLPTLFERFGQRLQFCRMSLGGSLPIVFQAVDAPLELGDLREACVRIRLAF